MPAAERRHNAPAQPNAALMVLVKRLRARQGAAQAAVNLLRRGLTSVSGHTKDLYMRRAVEVLTAADDPATEGPLSPTVAPTDAAAGPERTNHGRRRQDRRPDGPDRGDPAPRDPDAGDRG